MVRLRTVRKRVQQGPTAPFSIHFSCTESQPSRVNGLRRHGLAPPNPASPVRSDLLFAAKPQSPGREPGGPYSFLHSQSLSPSEIDDHKIPDTDPKRVKNTTIFNSKVSSRVGKRKF
ncbi:hypothetical protein AVEN_1080-1 [Araneus ventricosus]|uniref:Uncharacterized protein n=1 Tax=Araneus ventricosus TaxID=182803 RepID=A0A4Y2EHR2_ARAVE|nr:hypothetical protein AVEN_1080-1 [Araneus ventricosus]